MVYYWEKWSTEMLYVRKIIFPFLQMKNKYQVYVFLELTGQFSVLNNFSYFPNGQTSVLYLSILFLMPPMLQISVFWG